MSNRAHRRRHDRHARSGVRPAPLPDFQPPAEGEELLTAIFPGASADGSDAAIEIAKKTTRQDLIQAAGDQRRSPVRWLIAGPTERDDLMDRFDLATPGMLEWFARHPEARLVVAVAEVNPQVAP